jgi:hypothetical protein
MPAGADFGFVLEAMIGPAEKDGAESFDITVCTPGWFAKRMSRDEIRIGAHTIFVKSYDYQRLIRFIERAIQRHEAPTWPELGVKLNHLGQWEFDGYQKT